MVEHTNSTKCNKKWKIIASMLIWRQKFSKRDANFYQIKKIIHRCPGWKFPFNDSYVSPESARSMALSKSASTIANLRATYSYNKFYALLSARFFGSGYPLHRNTVVLPFQINIPMRDYEIFGPCDTFINTSQQYYSYRWINMLAWYSNLYLKYLVRTFDCR